MDQEKISISRVLLKQLLTSMSSFFRILQSWSRTVYPLIYSCEHKLTRPEKVTRACTNYLLTT